MNEILLKILPVILVFILGYIFKRTEFLTKQNGDLFLKGVYYFFAPALILLSVTNIQLSPSLIYLPLSAVIIILLMYVAAFFVGKLFNLERATFGVFLVGALIMNIGFTLPFFIAAYGQEGFARISLFDFGNGLLVFTFVYYLACKYGNHQGNSKLMVKKFLSSPPIWALILAMALNLANINIPKSGEDILGSIGSFTIPSIMLALGIYFNLKIVKIRTLFTVIFIRMFVGMLLGLFLVYVFNLEGLNKAVVIIGASAPIGYNTLTFSSMENLDKEFAASVISYSVLIGIIFIPFLIFVL